MRPVYLVIMKHSLFMKETEMLTVLCLSISIHIRQTEKVAPIDLEDLSSRTSDAERRSRRRTGRRVIMDKMMMMIKKKNSGSTIKTAGGHGRDMNVNVNEPKVVDEVTTPLDPRHRHGSQDISNGGRLLKEEDNRVREHFSVQFSN